MTMNLEKKKTPHLRSSYKNQAELFISIPVDFLTLVTNLYEFVMTSESLSI